MLGVNVRFEQTFSINALERFGSELACNGVQLFHVSGIAWIRSAKF